MTKRIKVSILLLVSLAFSGRAGFVDRSAALVPKGRALGKGPGSWGDYNRDGYPDLNTGAALWRNHGGTNFTKIAKYGPGPWGDVNNDGYLDLFRYSLPCRVILYDPATDAFSISDEPKVATPQNPLAACWADFHGDGFIDLYVSGYETYPTDYWPDTILSNRCDGTMIMTWKQTGDIDPARGVTACDFDEDGDMDVYVSNYRLEANLLWQNNGHGVFTNVAAAYGVAGDYNGYSYSYGHTIGSAWGDLDNDGHFDLFVGNFSHPHAHQDRSKFYRNTGASGGYHFEDKSSGAGLVWQESFASPALGDYDNDGYLDLYFTTVYSGDKPVLYRNNGEWTFSNVTSSEGLAGLGSTYQAAWADINNDGFLDLVTNGKLFINSGNKNHWIQLTLEGDGKHINRAAIGAQVRIGWKGKVLTRQVEGGTGQGNQNDLRLHFGLGDQTEPVTIDIVWPNGAKQRVENLAVDKFYHITPAPGLY
ncbi:MAG: CRTAC1 family protein [Kiritimatiellae bacterium]|nr:CRTAC1 family protein [Kiritimatiellia bacterium]